MPNKNYINGVALERSVMDELEARDYHCFRSAGSHGLADVTAFNKHNNDILDKDIDLMYLWVSCKYNTARMSVQDKENFVEMAKACGVLPVEAHRMKRKRIVFTDLQHERQLFKN